MWSPVPWAVAALLVVFVLAPLLTTGRTLPIGVCGASLVIARGRLSFDTSSDTALFETDFPDGTYRILEVESIVDDSETSSNMDAIVAGLAYPCEGVGGDGMPLQAWLVLPEFHRG